MAKPEFSARIQVSVVWIAMLPTDNEAAARKAIQIIPVGDVRHYFDSDGGVGLALSQDLFPSWHREIFAALPEDHVLKEAFARYSSDPGAIAPLWDALFVFRPGVTWTDRPPAPDEFVKQLAFYGGQGLKKGQPSGSFVRDSFRDLPIESDWFDELRRISAELDASGGGTGDSE